MKKSSPLLVLAFSCLVAALPTTTHAQVYQATDFAYEGYRNVRTNGNDSTYGQGFTHRYVGSELRFLTIAHPGVLHEFRIADVALNGTVTSTTGTWDLRSSGALNNFNGIWYEQAKNRLWVTSAQDYTNVNHPAKVTILSLNSGGSVSVQKQFYLDVPAKRVYGGCNAVPAALVSQFGGPYVCGWGGYTSLVEQGGGASIGPTMYVIPNPDSIANGSTVATRTILDASGSRGVRKTLPTNYFDGGDSRQNPSSRPTGAPLSTASWLSPNAQGLGWMVWGDSYYNTGAWVGTTYVAVASLCKGGCWYQSSTLAFDGRQFELHAWDGSRLGSDRLARPNSMVELTFPRGNTKVWGGNTPTGNIAGATYDATSGRLYMIGFPFGTDDFTGRLYSYRIGTAGAPPPAGDSSAPTVTLTAPSSGATVKGTVTLSASAVDNVGVAGVWFAIDGQTVGSEDSSSPYQMSWNSATVPNGTHTVRAVARDAAGNTQASAPITVTISNAVADSTGPTVSIASPSQGSVVKGIVTVSASASDNVGVAAVQFTLNGVNLGAPDTAAPYAISWNTAGAVNGTHQLRALARDAAGNVTASTVRSVSVNNATSTPTPAPAPAPAPAPPTSSCTTPQPGADWTCYNGGWLPPGMPIPSTPAPAPAPAPAPTPAPTTGCTTPRPGIFWTCYNGGWLPPGMPIPSSPAPAPAPTPVPSPTPAPAPSPVACTTPQPGSDWVCVNGGWLPPLLAKIWQIVAPSFSSTAPALTAPAPSSGGCTSPQPGSSWTCRNGNWLPPGYPTS